MFEDQNGICEYDGKAMNMTPLVQISPRPKEVLAQEKLVLLGHLLNPKRTGEQLWKEVMYIVI